MIRNAGSSRLFIFTLVTAGLLLAGCGGGEPDGSIRKKFDAVVASDFKTIVGDLPKESLSDSMFFRIVEYKSFDKGMYSVLAVVDYYYLKDVHVKRTVKYRYVKAARKWERFANEYRFFQDSARAH
ncbi:MAG TPA: hypothetical protein VLX68_14495 [Chitinivibrionales bacterium]|nr:hypothetical protein [Chitinivibrionales bacterium]